MKNNQSSTGIKKVVQSVISDCNAIGIGIYLKRQIPFIYIDLNFLLYKITLLIFNP
ncbi:hypothetical protein [Clostridium ganghwense]|uniref:hypothetical protein n=1 Tax=Clostridium ganghwense TaxID=312089 RepID=UPI00227CC7E3|nr:hypothetical protein [Clostridium ganghwense]